MNISPRNNFDLLQNFIPYKIVKYKDNKYYININVFVNNANIFGYSLYFLIDEKFYSSYRGNEIYEFLKTTNDLFIKKQTIRKIKDSYRNTIEFKNKLNNLKGAKK